MKIFISWSGEASRIVASALNIFLKSVIQRVDTFYSPDMDRGIDWFSEISKNLGESNFGVLCLTPENLDSPWVLFEAGALAKHLGKNPTVPLTINFPPENLRSPLSQLNAANADKNGIKQLVRTINKNCEAKIEDSILEKTFDAFWAEMSTSINMAETELKKVKKTVPEKSEKELLNEISTMLKRNTEKVNKISSIKDLDIDISNNTFAFNGQYFSIGDHVFLGKMKLGEIVDVHLEGIYVRDKDDDILKLPFNDSKFKSINILPAISG